MKTIHKKEIDAVAGFQHITVRKGAKRLKIADQKGNGKIAVWFEVDTHQAWERIELVLYGTGQELEQKHDQFEYWDTFILFQATGPYVLHVYKMCISNAC